LSILVVVGHVGARIAPSVKCVIYGVGQSAPLRGVVGILAREVVGLRQEKPTCVQIVVGGIPVREVVGLRQEKPTCVQIVVGGIPVREVVGLRHVGLF
jgi:hypothetical protein